MLFLCLFYLFYSSCHLRYHCYHYLAIFSHLLASITMKFCLFRRVFEKKHYAKVRYVNIILLYYYITVVLNLSLFFVLSILGMVVVAILLILLLFYMSIDERTSLLKTSVARRLLRLIRTRS
jgi:hypothetical protein